MTEHKISWLNMPGFKPETWNPVVGCSKVSPGCDNCYAERMAIRLAGMTNRKVSNDYKSVLLPDQNNKQTLWNGHTLFRQEQLLTPLKWKTPRMVFVCSMSDLFHEQTDFEKIDAVFSVMSDLDQHIYVILTKRPHRMVQFFDWKRSTHNINWRPKDNIWVGITVENQEQANIRLPYFNFFYAAIKFISIEPMLSEINFSEALGDTLKWHAGGLKNCISWVICGGESGSKARPMHPDWVRSIRNQCKEAGTPFFFKQWGEWLPMDHTSDDQYRKSAKSMEVGYSYQTNTMFKVGRKSAGNLLDGIEHLEWPQLETHNPKPVTL